MSALSLLCMSVAALHSLHFCFLLLGNAKGTIHVHFCGV